MSSLVNEAIVESSSGTAAAWTSADTVLNQGEWGYETDTGKAKIGDGSTAWTSLNYAVLDDIDSLIDAKPTGTTDQLCKAWANFDGTATGTNAPTDGYNVTSVTRNSVGAYTVTFSTSLDNATYATVASCQSGGSGYVINVASPSVSSVGIQVKNTSGTLTDRNPVTVVIFGT